MWIRRTAKALLLVVSIALGLWVIEIGLNLWHHTAASPGPYVMVEEYASPFILKMSAERTGRSFGLGEAGVVTERPEPGRVRILAYGDSIGAGYKLKKNESYAYLIEQHLNAGPASPNIEVLNMDRGHSPTVYSFHVRQDVDQLHPHAVLIQIELSNDITDEAHVRVSGEDQDGLPTAIHSYRYILNYHGHLLAPISFSGSGIERTLLYAKTSRWILRHLQRVWPNPVFAPESTEFYYSRSGDRFYLSRERLDRGYQRMFESLAGIERYLRRNGIPLLLLITPPRHAYSDSPYRDHALQLLERAEADATRLGIRHVSALDAMGSAGGEDLFMDFCHPTAEGNRVIAQALEEVLPGWLQENPTRSE